MVVLEVCSKAAAQTQWHATEEVVTKLCARALLVTLYSPGGSRNALGTVKRVRAQPAEVQVKRCDAVLGVLPLQCL